MLNTNYVIKLQVFCLQNLSHAIMNTLQKLLNLEWVKNDTNLVYFMKERRKDKTAGTYNQVCRR